MPARVLVVASQPAVQLQLGNTLRSDGHAILVCGTGSDGLRRWTSDRPDLLVVDEELPDVNGLEVVTRLRQSEAPGMHTPSILLGASADVDAKIRALRAGADDYLAKPVHAQELSARVRGLLARFARTPQAPRKQAFGKVHAYYGAKGGVGSTTLAINTAIALHKQLNRSVALVDANLQFGDHRVFMDLGLDQRSIIEAVRASAIDADIIRHVMVRHDSGIDLMLGPSTPEQAEMVSRENHHLLRVIDILRQLYDYVIVDLDKHLDDHGLDVIGAADRLVVVLTADLSCLKNVRLMLKTMNQIGVHDDRMMLVLNRSNAFTGISVKSVENVLRRQVAMQIVNDYRSAISALNSGTPFMMKNPDSALSRGVLEWARMVDAETTAAVESGPFELLPAGARLG